jgi:hypothetical protein
MTDDMTARRFGTKMGVHSNYDQSRPEDLRVECNLAI